MRSSFDTKAKKWELPAYGESGIIVKVKGKPAMIDFRVTSETSNGYVYTSVKTKTGYNSAEHQGNWEYEGSVFETWYATKL